MQMFTGVVSTLNTTLLRKLANSNTLLHCLNSLVNYISGNLDEAEHIYADLLAQYEMNGGEKWSWRFRQVKIEY